MRVVADLHIHSKYARATSLHSDLKGLSEWAKKKGIHIQATGDFTHPKWMKELKENLKPNGKGLFLYNNQHFILSVEVSLIFENLEEKGRLVKTHVVILSPSLSLAEQINDELSKHGNLAIDGRPTLKLSGAELIEIVKGISKDNEVFAAHVWTPWFSLFGSKFGVDRVEEAFGDKKEELLALETGLSSSPDMNWMVSAIERYPLISNSDSHSPKNLGREANVFELKEYSYFELIKAIKTRKGFTKTYEFYPQEGKYFYDGHRKCNFSCSPEEAEKLKNICPVCRRPLTLGVLHRVYQLADRPKGYKPKNAVPFQYIIPLPKVIAKALGKKETSKKVWEIYDKLIRYFGGEFDVYESDYKQLLLATDKEIARAIYKVNSGKVYWRPGYDGVFGEFYFEKPKEEKKQSLLSDFS